MYSAKDISVVIPTYNRSEDLSETLRSLKKLSKEIREIIVVDQSADNLSKKVIRRCGIKNIRYVHSSIPSLTIARNVGVKNVFDKTKLICFMDDDVSLGKNYFYEIIKVFNENKDAMGVAAYHYFRDIPNLPKADDLNVEEILEGAKLHLIKVTFKEKLEREIKRIFFLGFSKDNLSKMTSAYGNVSPANLDRVIKAEWLPGVNMVYKREVFDELHFEEKFLGYTTSEDIDFSYGLFKKYPGSLYITPFPKIIHRASLAERYPTKKLAYITQIDHFYFNFKAFNNSFKEKFAFAWSLLGIFTLRVLMLIFSPKKQNYLKLKYFLESLGYCIFNLNKIRAGRLREFII